MTILQAASPLSRRRALKLGAGLTGSLFAATSLGTGRASAQERDEAATSSTTPFDSTPPPEVQDTLTSIIEADGIAHNEIFTIPIARDDFGGMSEHGVQFLASFLLSGELDFEMTPPTAGLQDFDVLMNGGICLREREVQKFIFSLLEGSLVFQSFHQHIFELAPAIWFVNFRGVGNVTGLATVIKNALDTTSIRFPQVMPSHLRTSLQSAALGNIIGAVPNIGQDGVVWFSVPRTEHFTLGGVGISNFLNISSKIFFEPLGGSGHNAAVAATIGMLAVEVNNVTSQMLRNGWEVDGLFNQETDEQPQLFFSTFLKAGNAATLAGEVRQALQLTQVNLI